MTFAQSWEDDLWNKRLHVVDWPLWKYHNKIAFLWTFSRGHEDHVHFHQITFQYCQLTHFHSLALLLDHDILKKGKGIRESNMIRYHSALSEKVMRMMSTSTRAQHQIPFSYLKYFHSSCVVVDDMKVRRIHTIFPLKYIYWSELLLNHDISSKCIRPYETNYDTWSCAVCINSMNFTDCPFHFPHNSDHFHIEVMKNRTVWMGLKSWHLRKNVEDHMKALTTHGLQHFSKIAWTFTL